MHKFKRNDKYQENCRKYKFNIQNRECRCQKQSTLIYEIQRGWVLLINEQSERLMSLMFSETWISDVCLTIINRKNNVPCEILLLFFDVFA